MRVVVRAPNWLGDIIMSFPFMHALNDTFQGEDDEIIVIAKPAYVPIFQLLPFPIKVYPYDKNENPGLLGIHRYCYNLNEVFNVDLYFALPPSFSSAFMGICFRAKERVGFEGQYRSMMLTHRQKRPEGYHRYQEYLKLLSLYTDKDYAEYSRIIAKDIVPFYPDWQEKPYIVVHPNSEASSRRLPEAKWVELLNLFEGQRFVITGIAGDEERVKSILEKCLPQNEYINLVGKTPITDLARIVAYSKGVISNDSGPAHLAAYTGANVAIFFGAGDPANTAPSYTKAATLILNRAMPCSPCLKNDCPLKTVACLEKLDMRECFEKIHEFFKIEDVVPELGSEEVE